MNLKDTQIKEASIDTEKLHDCGGRILKYPEATSPDDFDMKYYCDRCGEEIEE